MPFQPAAIRAFRRIMLAFMFCLPFISMPNQANAAITACRGDPIVDMPNYTVQSIVEISTDIKNVDRVEYVYYVPAGKVLPVMFDASPLAAKERVSFAKGGWGNIQVDTIVYLKPGVAPVQVTTITTITDKRDGTSITKTITGKSGQLLIVTKKS